LINILQYTNIDLKVDMALNFPNDPQTDDTYTQGNTTWVWDGVAWNVSFTAQAQSAAFSTVAVQGQDDITASAPADTVNFAAGANVALTTNAATNTLTISSDVVLNELLTVSADQGTPTTVSLGGTLQVLGGAGIDTEIDESNNLVISNSFAESTSFSSLTDAELAGLTLDNVYESAIVTLRVDNVGTTAYTFPSHYTGNNPTIYALAGTTIAFDLTNIGGHPFEIQNPQGDPYNVGLVHVSTSGTVSTGAAAQGKTSGTLYWRILESISGGYRYQCQSHAPMVGAITIKRLSVI
jgi:plastocyanin